MEPEGKAFPLDAERFAACGVVRALAAFKQKAQGKCGESVPPCPLLRHAEALTAGERWQRWPRVTRNVAGRGRVGTNLWDVVLATGISSVLNTVIAVFNGALNLDFHVFAIPIALGLLRFSESARAFGVALLWIEAVAFGFAGVLVLFFGKPSGETALDLAELHPILPRLAFALLVWSGFALVIWMLRVLRRRDVRELFERLESAGPFPFDRRSRKECIAITCVMAMLAVAVGAKTLLAVRPEHETIFSSGPDGWNQSVSYGRRGEELLYVVFQGALSCPVDRQDPPNPYGSAKLSAPDGREIRLKGKPQLYEIAGGVLKTSDERVSLSELEEFLRSDRIWSIDSLLAFVLEREPSRR